MRRLTVALIAVCLCLTACGGGSDSALEQFRRQWLDAVNRRQFERLYTMLDARSRRNIAHQLEVLRGLELPQQRAVIDQLGGRRVDNLHELSPEEYFALLWARATEGMRPTLTVEATGADSAYMELALDDDRVERIRLSFEAGRWVWHLPEQNLTP